MKEITHYWGKILLLKIISRNGTPSTINLHDGAVGMSDLGIMVL